MSGMLQNNDDYRQRANARRAEAHRWAEVDHLARLSRADHGQRATHPHHDHHQHSMRTRLRALRMYLHHHGLHAPVHLPHH